VSYCFRHHITVSEGGTAYIQHLYLLSLTDWARRKLPTVLDIDLNSCFVQIRDLRLENMYMSVFQNITLKGWSGMKGK